MTLDLKDQERRTLQHMLQRERFKLELELRELDGFGYGKTAMDILKGHFRMKLDQVINLEEKISHAKKGN